MPKLEPCPGCGYDRQTEKFLAYRGGWCFECDRCALRSPCHLMGEGSIEAWNELATATRRAVEAERERQWKIVENVNENTGTWEEFGRAVYRQLADQHHKITKLREAGEGEAR